MAEQATVNVVGWPERGADLLRAAVQAQQGLYEAAVQIGDELRVVAVEVSPVGKSERSGPRFRDSFVVEVTPNYQEGARVLLGNASAIAPFVLEDTVPHVITATHQTAAGKPGFLKFDIGGTTHYAMRVMHPGTKAQPIGQMIVDRMAPRFEQIAQEQGGRVVEVLAQVFSA